MPHPVVIIGAGPIGLAGAAHAQSRGLETIVLEAGESAGAAVREWGHVRLFSPWSELADPVAAALLDRLRLGGARRRGATPRATTGSTATSSPWPRRWRRPTRSRSATATGSSA